MRSLLLFLCGGLLFVSCQENKPETPAAQAEKPSTTIETASNSPQQGEALTEQVIYDVLVKTLPHQEEDVDWRLTNFPDEQREAYLAKIIEAVKTGKLAAYAHPLGDPTRDEEYKLTPESVANVLTDSVSFVVENMETGEMENREQVVEYTPEEVTKIEFVEEWSYNPTTLQPIKTVTGMCFMVPIYSYESGDLKGHKKLFYVWFNDSKLLEIPA